MITTELAYWLAASRLPGVSANTVRKCLECFSTIHDFFQANEAEWISKGLPPKLSLVRELVNWVEVESLLKWAEHPNHTLITYNEALYPPRLKEIHEPPLVLYVCGNADLLSQKQIAMVGAREATVTGLSHAAWFARGLVECGWVVTSGLAKGIDAASHRGALDQKGKTIAVCAAGLNHIYPRAHERLFHTIIESGGAAISEMPPMVKPHAKLFPRRNRLISGLSYGVLVVEAALRSGSLITAKCALEQGREVFAVPGIIHQQQSKGCHWLIKQGAKLVDSVTDIVEEWSELILNQPPSEPALDKPLPTSSQGVLNAIGYEITHLDVILLRSGLTFGELSSILLILELEGYIQSALGGYIRTAS